MLKHHYMRQEYIWRGDTADECADSGAESDCIPELGLMTIPKWGTPYNLFDLNGTYVRGVTISQLDSGIDTQDEWREFVDAATQLDLLVLTEDRQVEDNPIISDFANAETSRYLTLLNEAGVAYVYRAEQAASGSKT